MKNKKGFTLIELLVVISIIALLTSIIMATLNDARAKGRDTARIRAVKETVTALQMYFNDKGYYPRSSTLSVELEPYIKTINSEIKYAASLVSPTIGANTCTISSSCKGYHIGIHLEKSNPVLNFDNDINTGFTIPDGFSALDNCGIDTATTTDLCFDLSSN